MSTQKDFVKTALRLPPELHSALHASAREGARTFNSEILHRLRSTYDAIPNSVTVRPGNHGMPESLAPHHASEGAS